jgi:hypothetical protein
VDGTNAIDGISCPTAELCVAVDDAGNVLFTSDPTGGPSAWHTAPVDTDNSLFAISCPTTGMCVAVDDAGNVVSSSAPTGAASTWTVAAADPGDALEAISCVSSSDCVAVDDAGNEINSLQPTAGANAWTGTGVLSSSPLYSVSCPSAVECIAGDGDGGVVVGKPTPSNITPPSVSGYAEMGQALQETPGTWTDSPSELDVFWERCDTSGDSCTEIDQAYGETYTLTQADVNHTVRAVEFATNSNGTGDPSESAPTAVIVVPATPSNSSPPTITGTAEIGQTLNETHGNWTGHPTSYRYQWQDCDSNGGGCQVIAGATARTYGVTAADVGHRIRLAEYAVNSGGTSLPATSDPTAIVPVAPGTRGTVRVGHPLVGASAARVPVRCIGGFGSICQIKLTLTVIERVRHGRVAGVIAGTRRAAKRAIVLASTSITLSAPQSGSIRLTLGRVGKHLLAVFHRMRVRLTATNGVNVIWSASVIVKTKAKPREH